MKWYVYIALCNDKSLYTGITTSLVRREIEHNLSNKRGTRSLKGKRPIKIVYHEEFKSQKEARKRETAIKNWKRKYKIKLINKQKEYNRVYPVNFVERIQQGLSCKFRRNLQGR